MSTDYKVLSPPTVNNKLVVTMLGEERDSDTTIYFNSELEFEFIVENPIPASGLVTILIPTAASLATDDADKIISKVRCLSDGFSQSCVCTAVDSLCSTSQITNDGEKQLQITNMFFGDFKLKGEKVRFSVSGFNIPKSPVDVSFEVSVHWTEIDSSGELVMYDIDKFTGFELVILGD